MTTLGFDGNYGSQGPAQRVIIALAILAGLIFTTMPITIIGRVDANKIQMQLFDQEFFNHTGTCCVVPKGHKLLGWNLGNPQYSMLCGEQSGFCELCGEKQPLKEMSCCSECETVDFCQTCLAMARA